MIAELQHLVALTFLCSDAAQKPDLFLVFKSCPPGDSRVQLFDQDRSGGSFAFTSKEQSTNSLAF